MVSSWKRCKMELCTCLDVMMMQCLVMVCISHTEDADKTFVPKACGTLCQRFPTHCEQPRCWHLFQMPCGMLRQHSNPLWTTMLLTFVPKALWYATSTLQPTVNNHVADICSKRPWILCQRSLHCKQPKMELLFCCRLHGIATFKKKIVKTKTQHPHHHF